MAKRIEPGYYEVGRIGRANNDLRPRKTGEFGVITGEKAEENGHLEWSHICDGALKTSKWFAYRIGPGDNGKGTRTDLIKAFGSKDAAVSHLITRYGSQFDQTY